MIDCNDCKTIFGTQEQYDDILIKLPLPLLITQIETRKIVFANNCASRVYGLEVDELVGSSIDIIYTDEEQSKQIIEALDDEGNLSNFKTRYKSTNGIIIEALLSIMPVTYKNTPCRMGVISDITELVNTQDELKYLNYTLNEKVKIEVEKNQKNQMVLFQQSRHAQMGEMISMIAHQWRQPLNVLSLLVQQTFHKYKKNRLNLSGFENLKNRMMTQVINMTNTIDDFKNFFKPNNKVEEFNLYENLTKSISLIGEMLYQNSIALSMNCDKSINIKGYPNEFGQAVINILKNAQDILVEKDIKEKKIQIDVISDEKTIIVSIKDNAGGIPVDSLESIFLPYFSTKEKNGTGLGLYMTKMIIEEHMDAKIDVSNDNEGAVFKILFEKSKK